LPFPKGGSGDYAAAVGQTSREDRWMKSIAMLSRDTFHHAMASKAAVVFARPDMKAYTSPAECSQFTF
jgi:2-methylaconitate cis-trans-isomerase PrpF